MFLQTWNFYPSSFETKLKSIQDPVERDSLGIALEIVQIFRGPPILTS